MLEEDGELSRKDDKFPQYNAKLPRLLDKSKMSGASVIPLAHVDNAAMVLYAVTGALLVCPTC